MTDERDRRLIELLAKHINTIDTTQELQIKMLNEKIDFVHLQMEQVVESLQAINGLLQELRNIATGP